MKKNKFNPGKRITIFFVFFVFLFFSLGLWQIERGQAKTNLLDDFEKKIYERSSQKIRSIRKKYFKEIDSISSLEAYKAINQMNILEHLALELKQKRDLTLLHSLYPNKVLKVQHAEYKFKREMVSRIIEKTNNEAEKK